MRIIIALLIFSGIILFHEFGHFLLARLNGVFVIEFSLGMGPRLLSHVSRKSGTRYSLKILPFGGSCAMRGEDDGDMSEGAFGRAKVWQRLLIVAAGPFFNFLLAFLGAVIIVTGAGYDGILYHALDSIGMVIHTFEVTGSTLGEGDTTAFVNLHLVTSNAFFPDSIADDIIVPCIKNGRNWKVHLNE